MNTGLRCPLLTPCPRPAPGAEPRPEAHPLLGLARPPNPRIRGAPAAPGGRGGGQPGGRCPPWAHRGPLQVRAPRRVSRGAGAGPGLTHTAISSSPSNCRTRTCGPGTQAQSREAAPTLREETNPLPAARAAYAVHRCPLKACYCRAQSSMLRRQCEQDRLVAAQFHGLVGRTADEQGSA